MTTGIIRNRCNLGNHSDVHCFPWTQQKVIFNRFPTELGKQTIELKKKNADYKKMSRVH